MTARWLRNVRAGGLLLRNRRPGRRIGCRPLRQETPCGVPYDLYEPTGKAGSTHIMVYGLDSHEENKAKGPEPNWSNIQGILRAHFADQMAEINAAISSKEHPYWQQLKQELLEYNQERQLELEIFW